MKQEEFASVVLNKDMFTKGELVEFFQFFSSPLVTPVGFSKTKRSSAVSFFRCARFRSISEDGKSYNVGCKDYLIFSVDKDIMLHGLSFFGSENNDYTVTLEVKDIDRITVVSKTETIGSSKLMQYNSSNYYGFEIVFDPAVPLKENTRYRIKADISGPRSSYGCNGFSSVQKCSVNFTFSSSVYKGRNGTSESVGQFPEILFSV